MTITISAQGEFEGLVSQLSSLIDAGQKDFDIIFDGNFLFKVTKRLDFTDWDHPDVNLRFLGGKFSSDCYNWVNGQQGTDVTQGNLMPGTYLGDFPFWYDIVSTTTGYTVVDGKSAITLDAPIAPQEQTIRVNHFHSWESTVHAGYLTDGEHLTFLGSTNTSYLNLEKKNFGKNRYRLGNLVSSDYVYLDKDNTLHLPEGLDVIRIPRASELFVFKNSKLNSVSIDGLEICSSAFLSKERAAISITDSEFDCSITNSQFHDMNGLCVYVSNFKGLTIKGCTFFNLAHGAILNYKQVQDMVVTNNDFTNVCTFPTNSFAVHCPGQGIVISSNTFSNSGYGAIRVGTHYSTEGASPSTSLVVNNSIDYIEKIQLYDSGCIYITRINDSCVVRENYIYGYRGLKNNHAIYGDDGAYNVTIESNHLSGLNSGDYAIDCRYDSSTASTSDNTIIRYNKFGGKIRHGVKPGGTGITGPNYRLNYYTDSLVNTTVIPDIKQVVPKPDADDIVRVRKYSIYDMFRHYPGIHIEIDATWTGYNHLDYIFNQ